MPDNKPTRQAFLTSRKVGLHSSRTPVRSMYDVVSAGHVEPSRYRIMKNKHDRDALIMTQQIGSLRTPGGTHSLQYPVAAGWGSATLPLGTGIPDVSVEHVGSLSIRYDDQSHQDGNDIVNSPHNLPPRELLGIAERQKKRINPAYKKPNPIAKIVLSSKKRPDRQQSVVHLGTQPDMRIEEVMMFSKSSPKARDPRKNQPETSGQILLGSTPRLSFLQKDSPHVPTLGSMDPSPIAKWPGSRGPSLQF